jgi:two-component sensor histidine kinase
MLETLTNSLGAAGFLPHGYCFAWTPGLLWSYVLSDSLIAAAYYSIPGALWYFVRKRPDLPFHWIFLMFATFILACGTTHVIGVWNIWQPVYWLDATLKMFTAAVSVATAVVLWPLIPKALQLPSPSQLLSLNRALELEIAERNRAELQLREANANLEQRVAERTRELEMANAAINASLKEKEALLQEIHHRVKNNLQIVASMLSLQAGYATDPKTLIGFQESEERIRSMALIHEMLYQSESMATVDMADYVRTLAGTLMRSYSVNGKVALDCRIEEITVSIDTAVSLGLILNELVTNALKYAFPNGRSGKLVVSLGMQEGQIVLRVQDDGVGLGSGFQLANASTLGLRLVWMFSTQLRSEISLQSEPGNTAFEIKFKEPPAAAR